jgi:hypothetical protein
MEDNSLLMSSVPRALEGKSKIFGFEISDILVLFVNLSAQNLIFGSTSLKTPMVWGTTLLLAFVLFFVKRGKPDKYLQHLGIYIGSPTVRYAGLNDRLYKQLKNREVTDAVQSAR